MTTLSDRASHIVRTLQSALAALDDLKSAADRQHVYDMLAAHVRSASPMSFALPDPVLAPASEVIVPLQDGARVDLTLDEGRLVMYVIDASGKDAAVPLSAGRTEDLRRGLARMMGGVR